MTLQNSEPLVTLLDCASQSAVLYEKEFYSLRGGAVSKSVRVSALAKELNMTSKEVVALCKELGVGATSASSNMVDAQADRVRRFAVDRGLKREGPPVKPQRASTAAVGREVPRPPGYSVNDITPPNQPPHTPDNSRGPEDDKNNKFINWWRKFINWWKENWVRCLHVLPILFLYTILKSTDLISTGHALEWWSGFLLFHIILGALNSWRERKIITKKLRQYLKDLSHANERSYKDVEGSQSFWLLVVSIHGIAAVAGATISYFIIASFFNKELESYIFLNNEGAIAAITLIIVVASAAVVAVYVELAKSVRQQIDTYEVEISTLNQVLVEINDYAEQVWRHFDSVARTMLAEWKQVLESQPSLLSQGRINDLERPLKLMDSLEEFSGREFQHIDDREFWKYDHIDIKDLPLGDRGSNVNESYGRIEDLEHSRHRYRDSMNLDNSKESSRDEPPSEEDQRRRTRRLRYLGWTPPEQLVLIGLSGVIEVLNISGEWKKDVKPLVFAVRRIEKNPEDLVPVGNRSRKFLTWLVESGLLGIEQPRGNEPRPNTDENLLKAAVDGARTMTSSEFRAALRNHLEDETFRGGFQEQFFLENARINEAGYDRWWREFTNTPVTPTPVTPADNYNTFMPAHEKSLVYVMRELKKNEATGEFIDYAIRDFDRRVWNGHLNRTVSLEAKRIEGGLVATLNRLCAQLDLDPSVFIDDLEVFIHLRGLVWFGGARTGKAPPDKPENTDDEERTALYKYAAYSRFVFYALWLVEGPAKFPKLGSFNSASSRENMKNLKRRIDSTSQTATRDSVDEFLLLMLADQRSALFNWLRSVRACTVRKSLFDYEKELDKEQRGPTRHFGIEVIPARHKRLTELQKKLKVGDQAQKPIRLRSVYDLVPRQSTSAAKRLREIVSDQRYIDTYRFISISKTWERDVAIEAETMRGVFAWLDNRTHNLTVELADIQQRYLKWLVDRVIPASATQPDGRPSEEPQLTGDALLLVQALWLVSPTFKAKFLRQPVPSIGDASEVDKYSAVLRQISTYCLDPANANDMKNTFFGGAGPASAAKAEPEYNEWLAKFRERAVVGTEGN